eukprot:TRINITY_DN19804_c0_g1_i1.p1 TRINITY_DN19804_c0_g1~~TRINITY_DN19804_c0_g1_i1.p1  ORF type:complete len:268 (-),score=39.84 TRINITY_DN19804_c0_g1_i1:13-816(-)
MEDKSENQFLSTGNPYLDFFVPMMLTMSFDQPKRFWEMRYSEEKDKFMNTSIQQQLDALFVWFGEEGIAASLELFSKLPIDKAESHVLDVGCGNGHFCEMLSLAGFEKVTGTDFCESAIELCSQVHNYYKSQDGASVVRNITYLQDDILDSKLEDAHFDVVYDKGTLDSIAMVGRQLLDDDSEADEKPNLIDQYAAQVMRILKPGKFLIVLSCNHEKEELEDILAGRHGFILLKDLSDLFEDLRMMLFQRPFDAPEQTLTIEGGTEE